MRRIRDRNEMAENSKGQRRSIRRTLGTCATVVSLLISTLCQLAIQPFRGSTNNMHIFTLLHAVVVWRVSYSPGLVSGRG